MSSTLNFPLNNCQQRRRFVRFRHGWGCLYCIIFIIIILALMGGHTVDRIEYCNNSINRTMPFIWASNIVITSCENHKPRRKAQWSEGSDKTVKFPTLYWFHLFTHFAIDRYKFFFTHLPLYKGLIRNPSLSLPQILTPTTTTQWCRLAANKSWWFARHSKNMIRVLIPGNTC